MGEGSSFTEYLYCRPCVFVCGSLLYTFKTTPCSNFCVSNIDYYDCISPCAGCCILNSDYYEWTFSCFSSCAKDDVRMLPFVGEWATNKNDRKALGALFTLTGTSRNDALDLITKKKYLHIAQGDCHPPRGFVEVTKYGYLTAATFDQDTEFVYKGQVFDWQDSSWKLNHACPSLLSCFYCCFAVSIPVDLSRINDDILFFNNIKLYRRGVRTKRIYKPMSAETTSLMSNSTATYDGANRAPISVTAGNPAINAGSILGKVAAHVSTLIGYTVPRGFFGAGYATPSKVGLPDKSNKAQSNDYSQANRVEMDTLI